MRLSIFLLLILTTIFSCKTDNKKAITKEVTGDVAVENKAEIPFVKTGEHVYSVQPDSTQLKWIAYKTSDKTPVGGIFKTLNIENVHPGNNVTEAINGLKFSIPVSSVFTNNDERDEKLKKSFFGKMLSTATINGEIIAKSKSTAYANITMNGITAKLPVRYANNGSLFSLTATMDLKDWKGEAAIIALNEVCGELHKGKDGVSKTWDEVSIQISSTLSIK